MWRSVLLLFSALTFVIVDARDVNVQLKAGWQTPPIMIEGSEHLANINTNYYWTFLQQLQTSIRQHNNHIHNHSNQQIYESMDSLNHINDQIQQLDNAYSSNATAAAVEITSTLTDLQQYDVVINIGTSLLGGAALQVMKMSMALHLHTARAAMYNQLFLDELHQRSTNSSIDRTVTRCPVVIAYADSLYCDVSEVDFARPSDQTVYSFDHIYPSINDQSRDKTVILYADLLHESTYRMHSVLSQMSNITYVFRPKYPVDWNGPLQPLQGWGVELAIKNMEYKVLDDATSSHSRQSNDSSSHVVNDLRRRLSLTDQSSFIVDSTIELMEREYQANNENEKIFIKDNKDYNYSSIGVQATQLILASSNPLITLHELTSNFPAYASVLTKIPVHSKVLKSLDRKVIQPGVNLISLHGQSLSLEDLDIYKLLALFDKQSQLIDEFASMYLSPSSARALLAAASISQSASQREQDAALAQYEPPNPNVYYVKMSLKSQQSQAAIMWMNDMTSDTRYNQWPSSVREFLTPSWGNQLKYVRQNIYTGVALIDASTYEGLNFFHQLMFFIKGNAPIRVGVVFLIPSASSIEIVDGWNTSVLQCDDVFAEFCHNSTTALLSSSGSDNQSSVQAKIAKMFRHIEQSQSIDKAWDFLELLYDESVDVKRDEGQQSINQASLVRRFVQVVPDALQNDLLHRILTDSDLNAYAQAQIDWVESRGLSWQTSNPCLIVHGQVHQMSVPLSQSTASSHQSIDEAVGQDFRSFLMEIIFSEQRKAGLRVFVGVFKDRMDFAEYWDQRANTFTKLSSHIVKPASERQFLNSLPPIALPSATDSSRMRYLTSNDEAKEFLVASATHWIVADWESRSGLTLVNAALQHLIEGHDDYVSRIAFVYYTSKSATDLADHPYAAGRLAAAVIKLFPSSKALIWVRQIAMISLHLIDQPASRTIHGLTKMIESQPKLRQKFIGFFDQVPVNFTVDSLNLALPRDFVRSNIGLSNGGVAIITNGYVVVPPANQSLPQMIGDIRLLEEFSSTAHLAGALKPLIESLSFEHRIVDSVTNTAVVQPVDADDLTSEWYSDVVLHTCFALSRRVVKQASSQHQHVVAAPWPSVLDVSEDEACFVHKNDNAWLELKVLLNPISKEAQHLAGILISLQQAFNMSIQVFLNPPLLADRLPLKRFYQYAVQPALQFSSSGAEVSYRGAEFRDLETHAVLTMTVDTPEPWLIGLSKAEADLDNLKLDSLNIDRLLVEYSLEHLLISGQMFEIVTKQGKSQHVPPAGLQLTLSSPAQPHAADTVVMQNLGYFQLQANPGVWSISMAPRHSQIYQFGQGVDGAITHISSDATRVLIPVAGLNDVSNFISVTRRPGFEDAALLETDDLVEEGGMFSSLFHGKTKSKRSTKAVASQSTNQTVHIFSLASGHLYERFLKIMMLSVIQHTRSPVKFWFIRNFASPQFVEFLPIMAAQYGFEYEFVTYKWPHWLRKQEEKQRVIWGYKILFLDVLWPLNVERVIYIDADQVVRGDVNELWQMDLQGAPYAYVPFCEEDANPETRGFRFWDSGYWKDHLRGRPYHISALYVVDLKRFRAMRAGDNLRAIYDNLSADPNSLANLDQDLPNYTQHMVPIFSLPQEWLWCQTWCSMDSLKTAKTIDLCNNPLTKTPKLDVAKSLLPEWIGLDAEAKALDPLVQQAREQAKKNK